MTIGKGQLPKGFQVQGIPTFYFVSKDGEATPFQGNPHTDLKKFAEDMSGPPKVVKEEPRGAEAGIRGRTLGARKATSTWRWQRTLAVLRMMRPSQPWHTMVMRPRSQQTSITTTQGLPSLLPLLWSEIFHAFGIVGIMSLSGAR